MPDKQWSALTIILYYIIGHKGEEIYSEELAQKFGVHAIGEAVCRSFGEDGIFHGVVTAFRREGRTELYTVKIWTRRDTILDTHFGYKRRGGMLKRVKL